MAIYRQVWNGDTCILVLDIDSETAIAGNPKKGPLFGSAVLKSQLPHIDRADAAAPDRKTARSTRRPNPMRQRSVGCKLNLADYADTKKWADYLGVTMSQFVKGALALRVAQFEIAGWQGKIDDAKTRV